MKKLYILDTNVLTYDPQALFQFEEHDVCLPITVLEELDGLKNERGQTGFNARETSRLLDKLVKTALTVRQEMADLDEGLFDPQYVPQEEVLYSLGEGLGNLKFFTQNIEFSFKYLKESADNYLIGITRLVETPGRTVILVSNDINVRLKATAFGLTAQDYKTGRIEGASVIGLVKEAAVDHQIIEALYKGHGAPATEVTDERIPEENACYILRDHSGAKSALARYHKGMFQQVRNITPAEFYQLKLRNSEQRFLVDVLLDKSIDMVVCAGVAGSGKTLLTMAAGLLLVEEDAYDRVLITKAIKPVGEDIGYVSGNKEEKMAEWLKPFYDNLELVMRHKHRRSIDQIMNDSLEVEALTYMRGRSLMNRFVIIDECQNLTASEIKTIVSRVADSSKLVLLGDLGQIDNPVLSANNNGLAKVMASLRGNSNVAILNLMKSERGRVASLAIQHL